MKIARPVRDRFLRSVSSDEEVPYSRFYQNYISNSDLNERQREIINKIPKRIKDVEELLNQRLKNLRAKQAQTQSYMRFRDILTDPETDSDYDYRKIALGQPYETINLGAATQQMLDDVRPYPHDDSDFTFRDDDINTDELNTERLNTERLNSERLNNEKFNTERLSNARINNEENLFEVPDRYHLNNEVDIQIHHEHSGKKPFNFELPPGSKTYPNNAERIVTETLAFRKLPPESKTLKNVLGSKPFGTEVTEEEFAYKPSDPRYFEDAPGIYFHPFLFYYYYYYYYSNSFTRCLRK